jgi:pyrroline-5-carboxylate reductase
MINKKIGVIGFGNMGEAIVSRLASRMGAPRRSLMVADIDSMKLKRARVRYRFQATNDHKKLVTSSDVIILAVKPKDFKGLLADIAPHVSRNKVIISIAAGITTRYIEKMIGKKVAVIRVMPNMPALIGEAISSISAGTFAKRPDMTAAQEIFSSIGEVVEVDERLVDGVTAVSGSGPAYFFYLMECLIEAAMAVGLDEKTAKRLVLKTALGGAKLVEALGAEPSELRARVTSKGGTTEAAFKVLGRAGFRNMIMKAVARSRDRGRELSKR